MSVVYNLGSICLGLGAWILPLVGLGFRNHIKCAWVFSALSFSAALFSLCLQFYEIRHRVSVGDFSALMDTIYVLCGVVMVLVVVTLLLNAVLLWAAKSEQ